jgi:hypothetical protein
VKLFKISVLTILAGVLVLSMATPAFAAVNSRAHTLTLTVNTTGNSCSSPTEVSGTATGANIPRRDVKITITNPANGMVYAFAKAAVKHGTYSATLSISSSSLQEGYLVVTATWHGVVVTSPTTWFWAC